MSILISNFKEDILLRQTNEKKPAKQQKKGFVGCLGVSEDTLRHKVLTTRDDKFQVAFEMAIRRLLRSGKISGGPNCYYVWSTRETL